MYPTVPRIAPSSVCGCGEGNVSPVSGVIGATNFAMPKSRIFSRPSSVMNRFSGFRSRWTMRSFAWWDPRSHLLRFAHAAPESRCSAWGTASSGTARGAISGVRGSHKVARRSDRCLCKLSVHRQFHLPQEGSEARVAAQLSEGEVELDHVKPAGPLVESAVQPLEGVVAIAAPREDVSDNGRVNIRYLGRQFIKRFLGVGKMA